MIGYDAVITADDAENEASALIDQCFLARDIDAAGAAVRAHDGFNGDLIHIEEEVMNGSLVFHVGALPSFDLFGSFTGLIYPANSQDELVVVPEDRLVNHGLFIIGRVA